MLFRSFVRASAVLVRESNSRMATVPVSNWSEIFDSRAYNKIDGNEIPKNGKQAYSLGSYKKSLNHQDLLFLFAGPTYDFKVGKPNKSGAPPQFGRLDASCHYPFLTVATPTIQNTEGYSHAYVACRTDSCVLTKDYFVDVPFEVNPGDLFRVLVCGEEYIVPCPDIHRPGERIVVTMIDK